MFVLYCSDEFGFNSILGVFSTDELAADARSICQNADDENNFAFDYTIEKFTLDSHDGMAIA